MTKFIISIKNGETSYKMSGDPHKIAKSIVEIALEDDYFRQAIIDAFADEEITLMEKERAMKKEQAELIANMMLSKW